MSGARRLLEANAPYWAAEAELVRTYFDGPGRTPEAEVRWLRRQAFKELWDGVWPHLVALNAALEGAGAATATGLLEHGETLRDELRHFAAFAALYELVRGEPLDPVALRADGDWPENAALRDLRARHEREHGVLGRRARWFTEGGHMALYREGMRLAGRGGLDDRIAAACRQVHDDERDHMLTGLADAVLSEAEWAVLADITVAQLRQRLRMRSAQFGHPVPSARLEALLEGRCAPRPVDVELVAALAG